jgi:hypothetical protein
LIKKKKRKEKQLFDLAMTGLDYIEKNGKGEMHICQGGD